MDPQTVIQNRLLLVAFTAPNPEGVQFMGEAICYYAQPTYVIQCDVVARSWAASLVREATDAEAAEYWRERALAAEAASDAAAQRRGSE
jgi:hypothetical protein